MRRLVRTPLALAVSAIGLGAVANADNVLECGSGGYKYTYCPADARHGVDLQTQVSGASCVFGESWGYDSGGVWTDKGCRGVFRVFSGRSLSAVTSSGGAEPVVPPSVIAAVEADDARDARDTGFSRADAVRRCVSRASGEREVADAESITVNSIEDVTSRGRRDYDVDFTLIATFADAPPRSFSARCAVQGRKIVRYRLG